MIKVACSECGKSMEVYFMSSDYSHVCDDCIYEFNKQKTDDITSDMMN